MGLIREIETSTTPPPVDRLWLRLAGAGRYELLYFAEGRWRRLTADGQSSGGGLTDEEREALEKKIAAAEKTAAEAGKTAAEAKEYADARISELTDGAPEALDTFKELADKAEALEGAITALEGKTPEVTAEKTTLASDDANLSDVKNVKAALEKLAAKVWYSPITITSFTASPGAGTFERGYTVSAPRLTWATSKTPKKVTVNGVTLADPTQRTYTMPSDITATTTVTLTVTEPDSQGATARKAVNYAFGYAIYTGMAADTATFTADWIRKTVGGKAIKQRLASAEASEDEKRFVMKGDLTKYWWLVAPTAWKLSFGTKLGEGGAKEVGEVPDFMNDQGQAVPMTVYRANNPQASNADIYVTQTN